MLVLTLVALTLISVACGGKDDGAGSSRSADSSQTSGTTDGVTHAAATNSADLKIDAAIRERFAIPADSDLGRASAGQKIQPGAFDYTLELLDLDIKDVVRKLELAVEARSGKQFVEVLSDDVRGSTFDGILSGSDGSKAVHSGPSQRWTDGKEAIAAGVDEYVSQFELIYDSFFKAKKYLGTVHTLRVVADVKQDVRGTRKDGSAHQEHLHWTVGFRRADETSPWQIDRIFLASREQRNAPRSLFREVTSSAGLYRTEPPQCAITGLGNIHLVEHRTQYDYGGVCVYDVNNDGLLDIFMPNAYGPFSLFMNQGDGTFKDVIETSGITSYGGTRGAAFGDIDNDGDADLFICRAPHHHPSIGRSSDSLFENLGDGKFREITVKAGVKNIGASMSPVFLDYDLDGDLDLYVTSYGLGEAYGPEQHDPYNATHGLRNILYRNNGDNTFTNVTEEAKLDHHTYWSYAVATVDWNKDRYPDIYVANDFGPNNFYVNQGDGTFKDMAEDVGVVDVGNGMGAVFVDFNHDANWDLYVTNMQSSTGQRVLSTAADLVSEKDMKNLWKLTLGNSMFVANDTGKFNPSNAIELGIANCQWASNGDFADFDADADADLIVVNGYYSGVEPKDC